MKPRGTVTVRHGGKWHEIPLTTPAPVHRDDKLVITTPEGRRKVDDRDVVGWQWDGKTH